MAITFNADTTNGAVITSDTSGEIKLQSAGADIVSVTANGMAVDTDTLYVDATNNRVGIGTSSPSSTSKLHIYGTGGDTRIRLEDTIGFTSLDMVCADGSTNVINFGDASDINVGRIEYDHSTNAMFIKTNDAERMRIDSSGNVLVATTTNNSRNSRLALNGNSVTWSVGPNSSNSTFVVYNPSEAGVYLPSGNTAWVSTSDERLKNITGEITDAINKVSQLRAAEFTWKSDESNKPQVGLIAQDVQTVLPEAISENDKEFLGVSYTEVIPLLVAAIKEQQEQIKALETRIQTLESA